jgi:chromosome segregation ATPase
MGRHGVTKEDVFTACHSLKERGVPLNQENVRNELKTGSYTTVWRHLKDFREQEESKKLEEPKPSLSPLPDSLLNDATQWARAIWQKAWTLAQSEIQLIQLERDELKTSLSDKSTDFDGLLAETQRLEEQLDLVQKNLLSAQELVTQSRGEIETLKTQVALREQENKALLERAISAEQRLENKTQEGNELFSQLEKCKSKREALEYEIPQIKAILNAQTTEFEALKKKNSEDSKELRQLLERAITAEKELSFLKAHNSLAYPDTK